jgi:hypothetical protein
MATKKILSSKDKQQIRDLYIKGDTSKAKAEIIKLLKDNNNDRELLKELNKYLDNQSKKSEYKNNTELVNLFNDSIRVNKSILEKPQGTKLTAASFKLKPEIEKAYKDSLSPKIDDPTVEVIGSKITISEKQLNTYKDQVNKYIEDVQNKIKKATTQDEINKLKKNLEDVIKQTNDDLIGKDESVVKLKNELITKVNKTITDLPKIEKEQTKNPKFVHEELKPEKEEPPKKKPAKPEPPKPEPPKPEPPPSTPEPGPPAQQPSEQSKTKTYDEYVKEIDAAKNKNEKNKILYDMYETARKTQTNYDDKQYIDLVKKIHDKPNAMINYNKYMNKIRNLAPGHPNYLEQRGKKTLDEYYKSLTYLFKEKEPESVSTLPKKVTLKPVPEEELLSPKEKLAKAQKALKESIKRINRRNWHRSTNRGTTRKY